MSRNRRISALVDLAEQDIDAAEALLVVGNRYAAYHCQQAAEKLIKAVLLELGLEAGTEHRIDVLASKIPTEHPLQAEFMALDRLTPYATTYRYPTIAGRIPSAPHKATVEAAIDQLKRLASRMKRSTLNS